MSYLVYSITNKINKKQYVGITEIGISSRFKLHIKESKKKKKRKSVIGKAINKYGIDNFVVEQIDFAKDKFELVEKERYWIKQLNTIVPYGYNLTTGGEGSKGFTISDVSRKKMSLAKSGKYDGKNNPNYGKIHSAETRQLISKSQIGKKHTEEHKKKVSENSAKYWLGKNLTEETKSKIRNSSPLKKSIVQISLLDGTAVEWPSIKEAVRQLKYREQTIIDCCKQRKESAYGFKWVYIKQSENN